MSKFLLKERVLLYSSEFCLRELFNYNYNSRESCDPKVKGEKKSRVKYDEDQMVIQTISLNSQEK